MAGFKIFQLTNKFRRRERNRKKCSVRLNNACAVHYGKSNWIASEVVMMSILYNSFKRQTNYVYFCHSYFFEFFVRKSDPSSQWNSIAILKHAMTELECNDYYYWTVALYVCKGNIEYTQKPEIEH